MHAFSPENQLVMLACAPNPEDALLRNSIAAIDDWESATAKLIKKGVAPLFLHLLEKKRLNGNSDFQMLQNVDPETGHTDIPKKLRNDDPETGHTDIPKMLRNGDLGTDSSGIPHMTRNEQPGADGITDFSLPGGVEARLTQAYLKTVSRSMVLYDAFREIAIEFNKHNIHAVALKGIYLAEHLYPKIGMRQFSDIDLLCSEEEVEIALSIFQKLGFSSMKPAFGNAVADVMESAHLPPLVRNGVSVELHTKLHGPTQTYRLPEREMMERAEQVVIHGQPFLVFELHDLLIHLCLHLDKHFNGSHMQFYSWADIARLIEQRGHEIDASLFWQRCAEYNASREVEKILRMVQDLLHVKLPESVNRSKHSLTSAEEIQETKTAALLQLEKHLNDRVSHESATQTHLFFIRKIKSPLGKFNYLREVLFPGKRVMKRAYKLKNDRWFWLWYPYRFWVGFKGLFWKKK